MTIVVMSFTKQGMMLGEQLKTILSGQIHQVLTYVKSKYISGEKPEGQTGSCEEINLNRNVVFTFIEWTGSLHEWTQRHWEDADAMIFIGAAGIAVRAIAPFVKDKLIDPAVLVLDEKGTFCISLLSGHVGGANELTRWISEKTGSVPVITTATDVNDCFAIDEFAKKQNVTFQDRKQIKEVSAALLAGEKIVSIGIGCRKETPFEQIDGVVQAALTKMKIPVFAIRNIASIDLKKNERGILEFSEKYDIPFFTYSADELLKLEGEYTSSVFVESVTGVDNVCERSAVLASGYGCLIMRKMAENQVTVALAIKG